MFEPSRLAQQCLHNAYACVVPMVRRHLNAPLPVSKPELPDTERNAQWS